MLIHDFRVDCTDVQTLHDLVFFYLELPQKETIHMRLSQFLPQKQLFSEQYTAINCSFQQQLQTIYINLLKRMDNFSFYRPQYYYLE